MSHHWFNLQRNDKVCDIMNGVSSYTRECKIVSLSNVVAWGDIDIDVKLVYVLIWTTDRQQHITEQLCGCTYPFCSARYKSWPVSIWNRLFKYKNSYYQNNTCTRPSYIYNGNSCFGIYNRLILKRKSLYWLNGFICESWNTETIPFPILWWPMFTIGDKSLQARKDKINPP